MIEDILRCDRRKLAQSKSKGGVKLYYVHIQNL